MERQFLEQRIGAAEHADPQRAVVARRQEAPVRRLVRQGVDLDKMALCRLHSETPPGC
jgi:hypothetical protein